MMAMLSLIHPGHAPDDALIACHWRDTGGVAKDVAMGYGALGPGADLTFVVTATPLQDALCEIDVPGVDVSGGPALLRLDEVAFPQGAIAYRHIHPGPGIRTLVQGGLRLISDHDTQIMGVGSSWVEAANSPVRAENTQAGVSRFVRVMILPVALEGKPSIQILAEADAGLPRLQVTHRHIDHIFTL